MKLRIYSREFNKTFNEVLRVSWKGNISGKPQDVIQSVMVLDNGCELHLGDVKDCVFEEYLYNQDKLKRPIYKNDVLRFNNDDVCQVKFNNRGITLLSLNTNYSYPLTDEYDFNKSEIICSIHEWYTFDKNKRHLFLNINKKVG